MQILEAALAFAITMLVLSLICSSFVEIIHRIFSMREAGLQYMLGQVFDQVLAKHLKSEDVAVLVGGAKPPNAAAIDPKELVRTLRDSFVERMSANRALMGVTPKATLTGDPPSTPGPEVNETADSKGGPWQRVIGVWSKVSLWSGRDLTAMTPSEFMERLGSIDVAPLLTTRSLRRFIATIRAPEAKPFPTC